MLEIWINTFYKYWERGILYGGEQEFGFRAGTHAVHNIVGFGKAAEIALRDLKKNEVHIKRLDEMLLKGIATIDNIHTTVDSSKRVPGIISLVVDKSDFHNERFIKKDIEITGNQYGLRVDAEGLCYATLNLPDYLNTDIIRQGFMEEYVEPEKDDRYFLGVTPNIYRLTGFRKFKSIRQKLAVNGTLNMPDGYTTLVALPTGGGKSLITQTMAYQKKDGLTITVVPTVSLAMDQVRVAKENINIASESEIACYYSDLAKEEKRSIIDRVKNRKLRLLFISPEALIKNEVFKQVIETVNNSGYLKNLIIDEAHIVIEWGNFFRIDYQCLEPWRNNLYEKNSKLKTVLLSATYEKNTVNILKSMFVY